jgi:hypothetical protein
VLLVAIGQYSLLEAVKTSVVSALRGALVRDYPEPDRLVIQRVSDNIEMEYPTESAKYPGIWVQFSFNEIRKAGLDPTFLSTTVQAAQEINKQYMMGSFKGRVTLSIVAVSNLERDQISGAIINLFLFGRINPVANNFFSMLYDSEYVNISIGQDVLSPGGQTVTVGAPWQSDVLVYEDAYSFDIIGQFASRFETGELVKLSELRVIPELVTSPEGWV